MPLIRPLMLAIVIFAAHSAAAEANGASDLKACKAMAATLGTRQADITQMTAARDAVAETVEITGEAWEDTEAHRLASSQHAAAADTARAAYDKATQQLSHQETALQAAVNQYNDDISVFNSRCAKK